MTRIPRLGLVLWGLAGACSQAPIAWEEPAEVPPGRFVQQPPPITVAAPSAVALCSTTMVVARDSSEGDYYAAWWSVRPDSSADLVVAHSATGVEWDTPVTVDTLDAGRTGCRRTPPSMVADAGSVHVAYAMAAREGPGIFASHSMDRGKMFHSPVAVVYGERIGLTAIAARGNLVAVAYEDPNTNPRRVGLAVSTTMAHPFQSRSLVSPPTGEASAPTVALRDSVVTVTWNLLLRGSATPRRMMRRGTIR